MARQYWSWLNGQYTDSPIISVHSNAVNTGYGAFETIYFSNAKIHFLTEHLRRLSKAAAHYHLAFPSEDLSAIITRLTQKNNLIEARIRLTLLGDSLSPNSTSVHITATPYKRAEKSFSLITAPAQKFGCPLNTHKSTSYSSYLLAKQYALESEADDTLMTDALGNYIECSTSNLFFAKNDQWFTPCLKKYGLSGIQRQKTIEAMEKLGVECQILPIKNLDYDYGFITNSLIGVQEIQRIDQITLTPSAWQRNTFINLKKALHIKP